MSALNRARDLVDGEVVQGEPPSTARVTGLGCHTAARTKGSYVGAQYRQIARRRGPHSLSDPVGHMLSTGECFTDLGADYFQRRRDPQREAD